MTIRNIPIIFFFNFINAQIVFPTFQGIHKVHTINTQIVDYDCFIGEYDEIKYYKNTGDNSSPNFEELSGFDNPFNSLSVGYYAGPAFVDIDNDGDMDCFVGQQQGHILYFKNTGISSSPLFTSQSGSDNPFNGVDIGKHSKPFFLDIDNDGDMDCFLGGRYGLIYYYENTGTSSSPTFTQRTGSNNPFNGIDFGRDSNPFFVDIDNDEDKDCFIGEETGNINYFKNTGTSSSPSFIEQTGSDNPFNGVDAGLRSVPRFVDIDNN